MFRGGQVSGDIKWIQYHLFDTMGSNAWEWAPEYVCNWFSPNYNDGNSFSETAKEEEFGFPETMTKEDFDTYVCNNEMCDSALKIFALLLLLVRFLQTISQQPGCNRQSSIASYRVICWWMVPCFSLSVRSS